MSAPLHSPYTAVYGHDRTFVKRMSVGEYLQEVDDEERDLRGEGPRGGGAREQQQQQHHRPLLNSSRPGIINTTTTTASVGKDSSTVAEAPPQYALRRAALTSRDPRVVFSSKYPMHDRLGRELCLLYQLQDMAVEQEERRLRSKGDACRRSGVRLSAELQLNSSNTSAGVRPLSAARSGGGGSRFSNHAGYNRDEEEEDGDEEEGGEEFVTISTMSRASSYGASRHMSTRPSEFSIYRDSAKPTGMLAGSDSGGGGGGGVSVKRVRSQPAPSLSSSAAVPVREVTSRSLTRGLSQPLPQRSTAAAVDKENAPPPSQQQQPHGSTYSQPLAGIRMRRLVDEYHISGGGGIRRHSQKRSRDQSRGGNARLSRVRFLDEDEADAKGHNQHQQGQGDDATAAAAAAADHEALVAAMEGDGTEGEGEEEEDADDPAIDNTVIGGNTISHNNSRNVAAGVDAVRFTMMRDSTASRITKQLFRGTANGGALSRGTATVAHPSPIPSSAYGQRAATIPAHTVAAAVEENFARCGALSATFAVDDAAPVPELRCGRVVRLGDRWFQLTAFFLVAEVYEVVEVDPPAERVVVAVKVERGEEEGERAVESDAVSASTTTVGEDGSLRAQEEAPATSTSTSPSAEWLPPAAGAATAGCQLLLYRWRNRHIPHSGDESRRAAAGLCLCAPEVRVSGYTFSDGGGLTLIVMPAGYRAAPLSCLPLSGPALTTLLKAVLRGLSCMVARRAVHGNLASLGEMLIAFPTSGAAHGKEASPPLTPTAAGTPIIVPVHWERAVDFSMFIDRNAGRTVPYDSEDGSERPLLTLGRDLSTVMQCFLEHKQAAELSSEQYVLLQKLIVMAAEPTQAANYLVQIKNLTSALRSDLPALRQAYDAAVVFYNS